MLESIRELLRFYANKYHVPVRLITQVCDLEQWDRAGIMVALPEAPSQTRFISNLVVAYDLNFGKHLGGDLVTLDDTVMARTGKQWLVLCFHPMNDEAWTFARQLIEHHIPALARKYRHQQRDELVTQISSCVHDRKRELQSSIREDSYELERLSLQTMQLARKLESDRQILKIFEQSDGWIRKRANRTFVELMKLVPEVYTSFRLEDESVIGVTREITINFDGNDYRFDPFEVEVSLRQGKVYVGGGTNMNGYIHPHVSDERSNVCWGNIGHLVNRLAGEMDLLSLFQLVHQFLNSYNSSDPFQRIEKWDPDWVEESDDDEPYCSFCDDYGHTISECESCWWCDHCNEFVDHDEEDCPNRPKPQTEEVTADEPVEQAA